MNSNTITRVDAFDFKRLATYIPCIGGGYHTHMEFGVYSTIPIEQVLIDQKIAYTKRQVYRTAWILDVFDPDDCIHVYGKKGNRGHTTSRYNLDAWYDNWDRTLLADALKKKIATEMQLSKEELKLLKWKLT